MTYSLLQSSAKTQVPTRLLNVCLAGTSRRAASGSLFASLPASCELAGCQLRDGGTYPFYKRAIDEANGDNFLASRHIFPINIYSSFNFPASPAKTSCDRHPQGRRILVSALASPCPTLGRACVLHHSLLSCAGTWGTMEVTGLVCSRCALPTFFSLCSPFQFSQLEYNPGFLRSQQPFPLATDLFDIRLSASPVLFVAATSPTCHGPSYGCVNLDEPATSDHDRRLVTLAFLALAYTNLENKNLGLRKSRKKRQISPHKTYSIDILESVGIPPTRSPYRAASAQPAASALQLVGGVQPAPSSRHGTWPFTTAAALVSSPVCCQR